MTIDLSLGSTETRERKSTGTYGAVAKFQATTATGLGHAALGPRVAKWLQQYHELAAPSALNGGVWSFE